MSCRASPYRSLLGIFLVACALGGSPGAAAVGERAITLNRTALATGKQVLLADVAAFSGFDDEEIRELGAIVVGRAPDPGIAKIFSRNQVRQAFENSGFDMAAIEWRGANASRIEALGVEVDWPQVVQTARAHIDLQLQDRYFDYELEPASITQRVVIPRGEAVLKPWLRPFDKPKARIGVWVDIEIDGRAYTAVPVWFKIAARQMVAVADKAFDAGDPIDLADVHLEYRDVSMLDRMPHRSLPQLVGKQAAVSLQLGEVISLDAVETPPAVRAGSQVAVIAASGPVEVRSLAVAQRNGEMSEVIPVTSVDSGERYDAVVVGTATVRVRD